MKRIVYVDMSNMIYKSQYGREKINSMGFPCHAINGTVDRLRELLIKYPNYIVMAVYDGYPKHRYAMFEDYKAGRDSNEKQRKARSQFKMQEPIIKKLVKSLGIASIYNPDAEADDVVAKRVRMNNASSNPDDIVLWSNDKDWQQLLGDNVRIENDNGMFTLPMFESKYGIGHEDFLKLKAMVGDKSDNLLGVYGISEILGARLISKYGDIDNLEEMVAKGDVNFNSLPRAYQSFLSDEDTRYRYERNMVMMDLLSEPKIDWEKTEIDITSTFDQNDIHAGLECCENIKAIRHFENWIKPFERNYTNTTKQR